ncbi:MAG: hypothetical protein RLZZ303_3741, partial [Candidatus Hydrogenedentota bacterium]
KDVLSCAHATKTVNAMLRYVELKTGHQHDGPAWVGHVEVSRTGQTVYFNGHALKRVTEGAAGNHIDLETGEEYWVSGPKKEGGDRHWSGSGLVLVERAALPEYLAYRGLEELDPGYEVTDMIAPTDIRRFVALENDGEATPALVPGQLSDR